MPNETPARKALCEFLKKGKRLRGRPKETWLLIIQCIIETNDVVIDFSSYEKMIQDLEIIC